jgi:uncharacterized protein YeaO (DUF488 family)
MSVLSEFPVLCSKNVVLFSQALKADTTSFLFEDAVAFRVQWSDAMHRQSVRVKRVYDPPSKEDGVRVLVEGLWPRGLTKTNAAVDLWLKDIAPSLALRQWFNRDPARWTEFTRRYAEELDKKTAAIAALAGAVRSGQVTLLFGARDEQHNTAVALHSYLTRAT